LKPAVATAGPSLNLLLPAIAVRDSRPVGRVSRSGGVDRRAKVVVRCAKACRVVTDDSIPAVRSEADEEVRNWRLFILFFRVAGRSSLDDGPPGPHGQMAHGLSTPVPDGGCPCIPKPHSRHRPFGQVKQRKAAQSTSSLLRSSNSLLSISPLA
jgi:hypothetical protein